MKNNNMLMVAIAVIAVVVIGGAGIYLLMQNNSTATDEVSQVPTTVTQPESDQMMEDGQTIVDLAVESGQFNTLVAAVQEAGLVETLSGEGPFTVFAPTDAAFEALLNELGVTAEELLAREDLADILTYHVVPGKVMAADVVELDSATTVQGGTLTIATENGNVTVNGANVVQTDIEASNGVIHVIDEVLLPQ
jgi:transforming growth factor-beta-induced protein